MAGGEDGFAALVFGQLLEELVGHRVSLRHAFFSSDSSCSRRRHPSSVRISDL